MEFYLRVWVCARGNKRYTLHRNNIHPLRVGCDPHFTVGVMRDCTHFILPWVWANRT